MIFERVLNTPISQQALSVTNINSLTLNSGYETYDIYIYIYIYIYMIHNQNSVCYRKFRHIVAYSENCVTFAYSESCPIQNHDIFRTQDIFRTLSRHIMAYSELCVTLAYSEPCHIQNFGIFRSQGMFRILFI